MLIFYLIENSFNMWIFLKIIFYTEFVIFLEKL